MYSKWVLAVCFLALMHEGFSRPGGKSFTSKDDVKEWETRKPEVSLLKQLEKSGVGVKRNVVDQKTDESTRLEVIENAKNSPVPTKSVEDLPQPSELPESEDQGATRIKKQSPNNVCIKVGACGKTVCGPIVSAHGPVVGDMRAIMQGMKPMTAMDDMHSAALSEMNQNPSKMHSSQARTVDLMGLTPTISLGYGTPAVYSAPLTAPSESSGIQYGHSFFKPQPVSAVPAVPVAVISQHQPHQIVHPWMMPHLLPHIMPHLVSGLVPSLASFITPHRFEPQRYQEIPQAEIKQPLPPVTHFSFSSPDQAMICQPVRNQRYDNPYDYIYKPDVASDKSLNVSDVAKKIQGSAEDSAKIQEHLRKVNEIKEEISLLNRAAQRIVDQQERMTEMQQKQLWNGGSSAMSSMHSSDHMSSNMGSMSNMGGMGGMGTPYMGSGYYSHPSMPWGYSRSNILSYPNTHDDIEFFLNLLKAGKKIGIISDTLQPVLSTVGEVMKGGQDSGKMQKDATTDTVKSNSRLDDMKTTTKSM